MLLVASQLSLRQANIFVYIKKVESKYQHICIKKVESKYQHICIKKVEILNNFNN